MGITLSDEARQCLAVFEDATGATARDCVVDAEHDRVIVLVAAGEMGTAIGPGGQNVRRVERTLGRDVTLIEDAPVAEEFVANALAPAAVYNVTISEGTDGDDTIAYVEVDEADTGVAIGADGANVDAALAMARRHFGVDEIQLT